MRDKERQFWIEIAIEQDDVVLTISPGCVLTFEMLSS